jgi:Kef-type K+ transport system membrane component KefB
MASSLPYHEPSITDILTLSTFLLSLNLVDAVLNRTLYCGLVGQVLLGIAWGVPGANWLSLDLQHAVVQLGYIGLIMLVFQGGLAASVTTMSANMGLSTLVAITGIAVPMGLSFLLGPLVDATPLQCFAAGAALCSTSLGTTFTVLSTSGLVQTRLGSVLSTAAMMDDVVGLVMVQVVSSLGDGEEGAEIPPAVVVRPVLVSLAFAVAVPLACRYLVRPIMSRAWRKSAGVQPNTTVTSLKAKLPWGLLAQTGLLLGMISGAAYAGASVLLAAYLAGVTGSWWREEEERLRTTHASSSSSHNSEDQAGPAMAAATPAAAAPNTAPDVYERYYEDAIERILKPFFFVSHA